MSRTKDLGGNKGSRGLSLPELLVTLGLLGILGYLFVWILIPAMHMSAKGAARVDVQQLAVLCANRIATDLQQQSAKGAISFYPRSAADPLSQPVLIAMIPMDDVSDRGRRNWKQEILVYWWDRNQRSVYRRTWPPGPPDSSALSVDPLPLNRPSLLEPADLLLLADSGSTAQPIAKKIVDFDARWLDDDVKNTVIIDIAVEQEVAGKQTPERFEFQKVTSLRN